jgi:hypothetical protein
MYGAQISGKWFGDIRADSDLWLLRHDTRYGHIHFNGTAIPGFLAFHVSEIHSQTRAQQAVNNSGPMVSIIDGLPSMIPGGCTCVADPVGVPDTTHARTPGLIPEEDMECAAHTLPQRTAHALAHACALLARTRLARRTHSHRMQCARFSRTHEPSLHRVCCRYLGRINLTLAEADGAVVTLDHWANWFFHVFMEVDKSVPWYGKAPRRLASAYAGTACYDNWNLTDPLLADTTVWKRGIPTSPMRVGPDHGKFCMNPQNVTMCSNISQTTFPPKPAAPLKQPRTAWSLVHKAMLPSVSADHAQRIAAAATQARAK